MDGTYSLADIAAATGTNNRNNDGMWGGTAHGGSLSYSSSSSADGVAMAGETAEVEQPEAHTPILRSSAALTTRQLSANWTACPAACVMASMP